MLSSRCSSLAALLLTACSSSMGGSWSSACASDDCLDGCLQPKFAEFVRAGASSREAFHAEISAGSSHERFVGRLYRNLPYVLITCSDAPDLSVRILAGEERIASDAHVGPDPTVSFTLDRAAPVRVKLWGESDTSVDFRLLSLDPQEESG